MRKKKDNRISRNRVPDELGIKREAAVRKRRIRLLALVLFVLITAFYAVWSIMYVMTGEREEIRLSFLKRGTIDVSTTCPIVFLEGGAVTTTPSGGILVPLVADGERVARNSALALIVAPENEREVLLYKDVREAYDAELFLESGFADSARYPSPRSPSDSRLRHSIRNLTDLTAGSDLRLLRCTADRMRQVFARARFEAAGFAEQTTELARLADECDGILEYLRTDGRTVLLRAPVAGEVCFSRIGLPGEAATLEEMWRDPMAVVARLAGIRTGVVDKRYTQVAAGEDVASIQRFSGMSVATYLDNATAERLSVTRGSRVDLHDQTYGLDLRDCLVERMEKLGPGRLYLFSCDALSCPLPPYAALKEVTLVAGQLSGLRVPTASLIDSDPDTQGARLRCVRGGVTQTVEVQIVAMDARYALILSEAGEERPIREADLYVANPWSTEDGQLID